MSKTNQDRIETGDDVANREDFTTRLEQMDEGQVQALLHGGTLGERKEQQAQARLVELQSGRATPAKKTPAKTTLKAGDKAPDADGEPATEVRYGDANTADVKVPGDDAVKAENAPKKKA